MGVNVELETSQDGDSDLISAVLLVTQKVSNKVQHQRDEKRMRGGNFVITDEGSRPDMVSEGRRSFSRTDDITLTGVMDSFETPRRKKVVKIGLTVEKKKKKWKPADDLVSFYFDERPESESAEDLSVEREAYIYENTINERLESVSQSHECYVYSRCGLVTRRHERRRCKHVSARIQVRHKNLVALHHSTYGRPLRIHHRVIKVCAGALQRACERRLRRGNRPSRLRDLPDVVSNRSGDSRVAGKERWPVKPKVRSEHQLVRSNNNADFSPELLNFLVTLQERDITPEDYDTLLRLDDGILPETVAADLVKQLQTGVYSETEEAAAAMSLQQLEYRDITPEDYDLLLLLEDEPATGGDLALPLPEMCRCDTLGDTGCTICMEEYVRGDVTRLLPCGHAFHVHCIDEWLLRHSTTCPLDGLALAHS